MKNVKITEEIPTTHYSSEIAVQEPAGEIAVFDQFIDDAGAGIETIGANDVSTPFLAIIQKGSPQVDEAEPAKYIDGAKAGMIHHTLMNKALNGKEGVEVIPCGFKKIYTEWTPREQGGGFKGHHDVDSDIVKFARTNDAGKLVAKNGNWLVETGYYFVLVNFEGAFQPAMLSMTSTQLKKSRRWNSIMSGLRMTATRNGKTIQFNPPMFSHVYKMKTVPESNEKGSWFGWDISTVGPVTDASLYQDAKAFYAKVAEGKVQAGPPPTDEAPAKEEIPF